jgi:predicted RNA-binding Zn-ribbon protein involved in translation (DUF1610 family)
MGVQVILLLLGVLALVIAFVARPFILVVRHTPVYDHTRSSLLAERERLLTALLELDFDYSLGKVPGEDYPDQRAILVQLGAEVMKKIDSLQQISSIGQNLEPENKITRLVTDDDIESLITKRRSARREQTSDFCPNCGKAILLSDRFCPVCGKDLQ